MNQPEIVREWWQVETKQRISDPWKSRGSEWPSREVAQVALDFLAPKFRHARITHHIETKQIVP